MPLAIGVSLVQGAHPSPGTDQLDALDAWADDMGRQPATYSLWCSWAEGGSSPRGRGFPDLAVLDGIVARGVMPLIFWEPIDLRSINDGTHDAYLAGWWGAMAAWGHRAIVRFAHEQNGDWFPWSPGVAGQTNADYIAAWKRVVTAKRDADADNARMLWCPHGSGPASRLLDTYPGKGWTHFVGLDAYEPVNNGGDLVSAQDARLSVLESTGKPIVIGEFGITASGDAQQRARWLNQSIGALEARGVVAASYFDIDMTGLGEPYDWSLRSAPGIAYVLRSAYEKPRYQGRVSW